MYEYYTGNPLRYRATFPDSNVSKPKTSGMKQAPDTDPGMYTSRVVSTLPQAAVGGAKNLIWDLIGLPMAMEYSLADVASLLKDSDTPFLRDIGQWSANHANYVKGGLDLWDEWGENVDDALYGDRKVDAQGKEYRDGYNADGSMPVAQYALKGLGSALNGPFAIAQGLRGYSPIQPIADIWNPISPEVRRAMYTPTAELKYSDPVGTYDAFVKEGSIDPRVATMSLSRLGADLLGDVLGYTSMGTGAVKGTIKGAKLGTKVAKATAKGAAKTAEAVGEGATKVSDAVSDTLKRALYGKDAMTSSKRRMLNRQRAESALKWFKTIENARRQMYWQEQAKQRMREDELRKRFFLQE